MDALTRFVTWLLGLFHLPPTTDTPEPAQNDTQPAPLPTTAADPIDGFTDAEVLARTLWGEARSQGAEGMQAVCNVIQNRAATPGWWGHDLRSVCLKSAVEKNGRVVHQFSCWNTFDPQAERMRAPSIDDASYPVADSLALRAVSGRLPDITHGADHYETVAASTLTHWDDGHTPTFRCGTHVFFKLGLAG